MSSGASSDGRSGTSRPRLDDATPDGGGREARGGAADPGRAGADTARPSSTASTSSRGRVRRRPDRHVQDAPTGMAARRRPTLRRPDPSPRVGEHTGRIEVASAHAPVAPIGARRLPLDGVRVLDLTAWWAGPVASGMIAALGADVIHVESVGRPDGMRMTGRLYGSEGPWWERASYYLCANANKRDLTLDLTQPVGRSSCSGCVPQSDAVIENFTPRVLGNFGLTWDDVRELQPSAASSCACPRSACRVRGATTADFAQTMEQVSGLAWITGHPWDQPRIQRGPSDPNAGMHAAFALVVGLAGRDATGHGCQFEVDDGGGRAERRGRDRRSSTACTATSSSVKGTAARTSRPRACTLRGGSSSGSRCPSRPTSSGGLFARARGAGMGRRSRPRHVRRAAGAPRRARRPDRSMVRAARRRRGAPPSSSRTECPPRHPATHA